MLYQKEGMPEEGELVLCTVTSVQHHSVFVKIEEYGKSGMIHISEISPGRIRNIRDFVVEGKVVVCKVLRINEERGHIDLSLRRVSEGQRREKVNEIKQEQKAEKIIEFVAKQMKVKKDDIFSKIQDNIFKKYHTVYACFEDVVIGNENALADIGIDKKLASNLKDVILQRIKPPQVEITGKIKLSSYSPDGVEQVKNILEEAQAMDKENLLINNSGGGIYNLRIIDEDYKSAEKNLKNILEFVEKKAKELQCIYSFDRDEK